ncbi:RES domain-containing protein [Gemmobacter nectariphilus]|uniref:RES domain-containing protein n=1 Tax=Gemmobacter nectariphilus TaxID=220343 RepID=UPI0003F8F0D2|nr:RES domain-containing protein [Gemmobacter nectariphilus]
MKHLSQIATARADLGPIFDARDPNELATRGMPAASLADPGWRAAMLDGRAVPTQDFSRRLVAEGFVGLLVRSYVKGAAGTDLNMVLWHWTRDGCALDVIDDEDRLGRM